MPHRGGKELFELWGPKRTSIDYLSHVRDPLEVYSTTKQRRYSDITDCAC